MIIKKKKWHTTDSVCNAKKNREPHLCMPAVIGAIHMCIKRRPMKPMRKLAQVANVSRTEHANVY